MANAVAFLSLVAVLCMSLWLILSTCYRETWTQFIGLTILALASGARIDDALAGELATEDMAFFLGAALFLAGLVHKVLKYRRRAIGRGA
jgi:hypothetical protein